MHYYRKSFRSAWVAATLLAFSHTALSSAFALHEQNASGLGEFYAGAGAIAEEASTNFYNPAGLVMLPGTQFSFSAVNINNSVSFDGTTAYQTNLGSPVPPGGLYTGSDGASGSAGRLVPAFHVSHLITDKIAAGFSATAPYGLATSYDEDSIVRYQAVLSDLKTYNLGPSVAYKVMPWLSLAAGFDAQYAEVELSSAVNYTPVAVPNASTDDISKNTADSWGWGWHAGALAMISPQSRVGLNFRSNIEHHFSGNSVLDSSNGDRLASSHVDGDMDFPWMFDLSGVHAFNEKWSVLGSVSYTHWSSISGLELNNVVIVLPNGDPHTGTVVDELDFDDSWSAFAGIRYAFNPTVMMKLGGGYDQTPTDTKERDLRLPDSDRWIASLGLRFTPPKADKVSVDIAYARLFAVDADIHKSMPAEGNPVNTAEGTITGHADLIGAQLTLRI